ncbi:MAG: fatty acid desaturase [Planctomycetota bacterium]
MSKASNGRDSGGQAEIQHTHCRTPGFSFQQARALIDGLGTPNPKIYWADFLASIIGGHLSIHLIFFLPRWYPDSRWMVFAVVAAYVATVLLYMRSLMFIHELVHLPRNEFKGFRIAWNALCGILFFVPSFLYYPHVDHHRRKHYGTEHDGEYLALSHHGRWMVIGFIVQAAIIPFLAIIRFLIISPACWVVPGWRAYVHRHASTMVVDPFYERSDASPRVMKCVLLQVVLCFVWWVWFLIRGGVMRGEWLDPFWLVAYSVALGILVLNEVRTLGAHRWTNQGGEMTFEDQLLDSVNYPDRPWITELWGPIGTRYHALHHLFPRIPYHDLGKAHRRLTAGLPADSIYHQTSATSLLSEIAALWKRASGASSVDPSANKENISGDFALPDQPVGNG